MEKKNKKKLFAIIGGSVLAFVLTIALSVSITLAYFGDTATGDQKITMDAAVNVDNSMTSAVDITGALPGQGIDLTATATVDAGANGAFLAATISVDGDASLETAAAALAAKGWAYVDGYYYYIGGEATTGTASTAVAKVNDAGTAVLTTRFVIPTTLKDNDETTPASSSVAEAELTVEVTFIAVQGKAFYTDADKAAAASKQVGDEITTPTIGDIAAMVQDVLDDTPNA